MNIFKKFYIWISIGFIIRGHNYVLKKKADSYNKIGNSTTPKMLEKLIKEESEKYRKICPYKITTKKEFELQAIYTGMKYKQSIKDLKYDYSENVMAIFLCPEKNDTKEDIIIYNIHSLCNYWAVNDICNTVNLKKTVEQIIKHEYRHAIQVKELRKKGGSELVKKAFAIKQNHSYGVDPMEWDAILMQLGKKRRIEEFVKEIIEE